MIDQISNFITSPVAILLLGLILDLILRLKPSQKSLGVLQVIGEGAKKIGTLLIKLGELSDKVLPQRLNPPQS